MSLGIRPTQARFLSTYQFSSVAQLCLILHLTHGMQHTRLTWILLKFMSIESVMPSDHLILCHPLLLLPSAFPSIRVFSRESVLRIRWPKYWNFSISPSLEYSWLISFRINWFYFLAVQWIHKSLLQYHSSFQIWTLGNLGALSLDADTSKRGFSGSQDIPGFRKLTTGQPIKGQYSL